MRPSHAAVIVLLLAPLAQAGPVVPLVLQGTATADGDFLLQWAGGGPDVEAYILVRTVAGEDPVRISLPSTVTEYLDRVPSDGVVSYVVSYVADGSESPPSNPVLRSWPHCAWYDVRTSTIPPEFTLRPWCLWPPPELPPG